MIYTILRLILELEGSAQLRGGSMNNNESAHSREKSLWLLAFCQSAGELLANFIAQTILRDRSPFSFRWPANSLLHIRLRSLCFTVASLLLVIDTIAAEPSRSDSGAAVVLQTGPPISLYHPIGHAICRVLNGDSSYLQGFSGSRCRVQQSNGSLANQTALAEGSAQLALLRDDQIKESGFFNVLPLYTESLVLLVKSDRNIRRIEQLGSLPVFLGEVESGVRELAEEVLQSAGWSAKRIARARSQERINLIEEFCSSSYAATFLMTGHPAATIKYLAATCNVQVLPAVLGTRQAWSASKPNYRLVSVDLAPYVGNEGRIETIGIGVSLAAREEFTDVAGITASLERYASALAQLQPILKNLEAGPLLATHQQNHLQTE